MGAGLAKLAPGLCELSLNGSLTQILSSHYGLSVVRNRMGMRPCALVKDVADGLGVKAGTPGLLVVRNSLDQQGRVVEYDQEWRGCPDYSRRADFSAWAIEPTVRTKLSGLSEMESIPSSTRKAANSG